MAWRSGPALRRWLIAALLAAALGAAPAALGAAPGGQPTPPPPPPPGGQPAPTPAGQPPPTPAGPCATDLSLRCPNLVMSAPYDLHLDRRSVPGRVLLRATSSVNNYGSGPIELRARRARGPHMRVWQVIYDSRQRAHLFATRGRLDLKRVSGYRYDEPGVGTAYYWKFHNAAAFEVWSLDAQMKATALVRTGPKLDYCLRDLFRTLPSGASPEHRIYPGCNQDPGARRDRLGTSAGWSDVYPYGYPEQWVDVTGLRGRFAFVHIADPRHLLNESKPNDNISETLVSLPSGRVFGHRVGLARP